MAKLWMNENSVVNTKAAYFTALNAGLAAGLNSKWDSSVQVLMLCVLGFVVSSVAGLSIGRTCGYRQHFRNQLALVPGYRELLQPKGLHLHQRLRSNILLTWVPFLTAGAWLVLGGVRAYGLFSGRYPGLCP